MKDEYSFVAMVAAKELRRKQKAYDRKRKEKRKVGKTNLLKNNQKNNKGVV